MWLLRLLVFQPNLKYFDVKSAASSLLYSSCGKQKNMMIFAEYLD